MCQLYVAKMMHPSDTINHAFIIHSIGSLAVQMIESIIEKSEEILCLQIISEGVMIRTRAQDGSWLESMVIDRECFVGTDLWQYMQPEWM